MSANPLAATVARLQDYYRGVCANYEPSEPDDSDTACKHCWCFDDAHNAKALLDDAARYAQITEMRERIEHLKHCGVCADCFQTIVDLLALLPAGERTET